MIKKAIKTFAAIFILAAIITSGCSHGSENDEDYSNFIYIALGDSITAGNDGFSPVSAKVEYPYPVLVEEELKLRLSYNYGLGGSTVAEGENSFFAMSTRYIYMQKGDIVSVFGGVNDFGHNIPLGKISDTTKETFYGALNALAAGLKRMYSDALIFFITPYKCAGIPAVNKNGNTLKEFADAVKEVCASHSLPCLDFYETGGFENEMNLPESDGIHPSQNFYKNYTAPQIADFIRNNLKADPK